VHPSEELYAILGLFDGEINICEKETEKGLERYLRVKKMSNQKYLEDELLPKKEQLRRVPFHKQRLLKIIGQTAPSPIRRKTKPPMLMRPK
jgi:KaiC/GvpD/RAD55 family RecA-like ATPase